MAAPAMAADPIKMGIGGYYTFYALAGNVDSSYAFNGSFTNYKGVAFGAIIFWFVLEGTRFIDLPDPPFTETRIAALRLAITGMLLIGLMAFRPQGLFGKKEEMVLGE